MKLQNIYNNFNFVFFCNNYLYIVIPSKNGARFKYFSEKTILEVSENLARQI